LLVTLGPEVPGVGLEVERSDLVMAHDDVGIARGRLGLAVGEVVELENPVLLRLEAGCSTPSRTSALERRHPPRGGAPAVPRG